MYSTTNACYNNHNTTLTLPPTHLHTTLHRSCTAVVVKIVRTRFCHTSVRLNFFMSFPLQRSIVRREVSRTLSDDGSVYSSGWNGDGELGRPTEIANSDGQFGVVTVDNTPHKVLFVDVATGANHTVLLSGVC